MRNLAWMVVGGLLAGCALPSSPASQVREATLADIGGCERIGIVTGVPGVYGPLAKIGLSDARNAAKTVAFEQGANTVVFDVIEPGVTVFKVTGVAYRC